jgi:hypothetical protein
VIDTTTLYILVPLYAHTCYQYLADVVVPENVILVKAQVGVDHFGFSNVWLKGGNRTYFEMALYKSYTIYILGCLDYIIRGNLMFYSRSMCHPLCKKHVTHLIACNEVYHLPGWAFAKFRSAHKYNLGKDVLLISPISFCVAHCRPLHQIQPHRNWHK